MDHVNQDIHQLGQFVVELLPLRQPAPSYMVQVTNEATVTYFSGPIWTQLANAYELEVGEKIKFFLDQLCPEFVYFDYKPLDDASSESSDHVPRDEDIPPQTITILDEDDDVAEE
jgi:hypothetical protein